MARLDPDPITAGSDGRLVAAQALLERELDRLVASGEYGEWFRRMQLFRRYSPTNSLWILAQRPDATRVASYRTWQQIGRQVRQGEHGIAIFHPKPYWIDPATGERVQPPRTPDGRARLERHVSFGVGYVFDLAQTDGDPLPDLSAPAPHRAPAALSEHLYRYCHTDGVTVAIRPDMPDGLSGYYQRDGDRIVLSARLTPGEAAATLAHELAHREDPQLAAAHTAGDTSYYTHHRADCEAVAEAAAHAISARFGHDITRHSAGYIAGWIAGDVDRFRHLHDRVGHITRRLIPPDRIDRLLDAAALAATEQARKPADTVLRGRSR